MKQIIVSGFGGQGVLSLGLMLSYAAMHENKNTSFLPSYGPEMRGGTANCSVVISEADVASPVISHPDLLIAFNEPSLIKFLPALQPGGKFFVDSDTVKPEYLNKAGVIAAPLGKLCAGNDKAKNIAMLGVIQPFTGLSKDSLKYAVEYVFKNKPQFIPANLQALQNGLDYSVEVL